MSIILTVFIIGLIISYKKNRIDEFNKYKRMLIPAICLLLIGAMGIIEGIYNNSKINNDVFIIVGPILFIIFMKTGSRYQISSLKDKKEISRIKTKAKITIIILSVFEVIALYGVFVLKR